jgi:16S rRNA (cytosine967-C5)-methyltransferase
MGIVSENIIRMHMSSVHLLTADLTAAPFVQGTFDRILVDAPCSGTGVLRRHPEGKWTKSKDFIDELSKLQLDMLVELSSKVRKDGRILYSTCSVLSKENEEVVESFLETAPFRLIDIRNENSHLPESAITDPGHLRLWPHIHGCDGFFAALLERVR